MKKGKTALGIIIVSLLLIGSVVMVSAAFKDWFTFGDDDSDLEGELAESADVSLTITGTYPPPEIVYISDLNYKTGTTIIPSDRDLTPGTTTAKTFYFYVYSSAGTAALPLSPLAGEAYIIAENLVGGGKGDGNQRQSTSPCTGTVINGYNTNTDDCDAAGTYCTGPDIGTVDVVRYDCSVSFQHYESPTVDDWRIYAYIEDLQSPTPNVEGYDGAIDTANSIATPIRTTEFNAQSELEITDDTLEFGSVDFGINLNKVPTEGDPGIQNIGNVDIAQVDLTPFDIPETPNIGTYFERENIVTVKTILKLLRKPKTLIQFVTDRPGHGKVFVVLQKGGNMVLSQPLHF